MGKKSYGYFMPPVSIMGVGCLEDIANYVKPMGFKKALIVTVPQRFADIAQAMGKDVAGLSLKAAAKLAIDAIRQLSDVFNIPAGLRDLKAFSAKDIPTLSVNALKDACGATNPKQATQKEIEDIYKAAI